MTKSNGSSARDLAGFVRRHRESAGLTQSELAARAGMSLGAVRDLEQGRTTRPRRRSLDRLVAALGVDPPDWDELFQAVPATGPGEEGAAADGLWLGLLGPLIARRGPVPVALGSARQRALLGLLALYPATGVHRDAIVDTLWQQEPPPSAIAIIQSQVSLLRRQLDPGPSARPGEGFLVADGPLYRLRPPVRTDAGEFALLAERADLAVRSGDLATACELYESALRLWRGEPVSDVDLLSGHPAVVGLAWQRSAVVVGYAEAAATAGWPDKAVAHLQALAALEPLNERAHALLMATLSAAGQRAAALAVYEGLRHRLDEELGVRPGNELAAAHLRVLRQDDDTQIGAGDAGGQAGSGALLPRQLPLPAGHFIGRSAELAELDAMLDQAGQRPPGTLVISAIGGAAGVGKTALALQWARQVADRFPDGQLHVNLRGYDPDQPMPAADALAGFLRALGVPGRDIPPETDERAARYRSLLARRRMLVVADNAGSAEQVRPLLPGNPDCVLVVTSRDPLSGLIARDGARRVDLDLLPLADAVALLRALIGERVDADPAAAAALADQCSRLPLALRVAAELAVARPADSLADLTGELADQQHRLELLEAGGDSRTAVRAVFSWSCRHLPADGARAFRLAGLHPGPDLDSYTLAALMDNTPERAAQLLDLLARAHLMHHAARPGRYGLHDLLRAYAIGLTVDQDTENERRAALTRLFDQYLYTAAVAMDAIIPAEHHRRPRIPPPAIPGLPIADPGTARAWLDAERPALVAVATQAAAHGWPDHATRLAATLFRYLDGGGHYPEAVTIHGSARRAARGINDRVAEATALASLGPLTSSKGVTNGR